MRETLYSWIEWLGFILPTISAPSLRLFLFSVKNDHGRATPRHPFTQLSQTSSIFGIGSFSAALEIGDRSSNPAT